MSLPLVSGKQADVGNNVGQKWMYTDLVKEHFFNPRNLLENTSDVDESEYDGYGQVGSPACGDMMKLWIKVKNDHIADCKWQTFGCASAIASTSMMSVMATENGGMSLEAAMDMKPQDIMERLGGLPQRKVHCSVLGDKALMKAINDYLRKTGQFERMRVAKSRIVDPDTNVTTEDIEEAVLEGAMDLESLQAKLKVAVGASPEVRAEVERLIKEYTEKYFGEEH